MKAFIKDAFGWGFLLWLIGFALGMILWALVPLWAIGWVVMPFAVALNLWVLFRRVKGGTLSYYLLVGVVWTLIAVVCDYFLLVKVFKPEDGYYKLDVYLYYLLTFALPVFAGWRKLSKRS